MPTLSAEIFKKFEPKHDFLIGIDSDGCVFDTMELKHKECFIPVMIKEWRLQAVSKYTREVSEFINLYSKWRGINRFPALDMVMDMLRSRPEVQRLKIEIPVLDSLKEFINSGAALGNPALEAAVQKGGDKTLQKVLQWSKVTNESIANMVENMPPFPLVEESMKKAGEKADLIVVSQTPAEALIREWKASGLSGYPQLIAGQEMGKKSEHLALASNNRYKPENILMIGDAPGDLKAARANNALFFPVNPGHEEESWERFYNEGIDRFLSGTFAGEYADSLLAEFDKLLPESPPW